MGRCGRDTDEQRRHPLTFSAGRNLDAALGTIHSLDADVSASIDVERGDVERDHHRQGGTPSAGDDGQSALRVNISRSPAAPAGRVLRLVMAVFSIIGMVATALWISRA